MFKAIDRFGLKAATEFRNLVAQQKFAMKDVIQREGLDVQFELRRSYDCFIDQDEANEVKQKFFASVGRGEEWTRDVDFVLPEHVEQVSDQSIVEMEILLKRDGSGYVDPQRQSRLLVFNRIFLAL